MRKEEWARPLAEGQPFVLQLGQRLQQVREEAEQTREDVARTAKMLGLSWHRPTVGQLEQGKRGLTAAELLLLPLIYGKPLRDLLPGDGEVVWLTEDAAVYGPELWRILEDGYRPPVGPGRWHPRRVFEDLRDSLDAISATLDELPWRAQSAYAAVPDEAETKAAKRLNTTPAYVAYTAREMWGRGLAEERDARLAERGDVPDTPRALQAARGHVTRTLIAELEPAIRRYEELRGQPDFVVEKTERGIRITLEEEDDERG
jgi:transcriptional regulator with XRE-family HTH domain